MKLCHWLRLVLLMLAAVAATGARGETIYKSVGADGKVIYSDKPPTNARVQKTLQYRDLPASPLPDSVRRYREQLEASVEKRLSGDAAADPAARLFTASWCGYCRKARAHLARRGIAIREFDIETPDGMKAYASAGGQGVPVLVWQGRRIDGYSPEAYDDFANAFARQ